MNKPDRFLKPVRFIVIFKSSNTESESMKLTRVFVSSWKVRIWDKAGHVSSWSPVAEFSTGLLRKDDWEAAYIGFST